MCIKPAGARKRNRPRTQLLYLFLAVVLIGYAEPAWGLTSLSGSAVSWGEAGAVVARPETPGALAVNPAAVAKVRSWEVLVGAVALRQGGSYASGGGWTLSGPQRTFPFPVCSGVIPVAEGWTIGLAITNPYRRWVAWPDELADSLAVTGGEFKTAALTAALAWESSSRLTLGLGLEFLHGGARVRSGYWPLPQDPALRGRASFEADGLGTGLTLGLLWRVTDRTIVGVALAEASPVGAEGEGTFEVPPEQSDSYPGGHTHAALEVPASFTVGVSHRPYASWVVELDLEWQGSSRLREIEFELAEGDTTWTWDLGWRDALVLRMGTSWRVASWLTLRAGYGWERTLAGSAGPSALLPGKGEETITAGVGLARGPYGFDFALATTSRDGSGAGSPHFPLGTLRSRNLALAFSLAYRFVSPVD